MVRLTDRPDMILDVYRGRKQQYNNNSLYLSDKKLGQKYAELCMKWELSWLNYY